MYDKFTIGATKNGLGIEKEAKRSCKMLTYNCSWNLDEVLLEINKLNPKEYPNLFIFKIQNISLVSKSASSFSNEHKYQQIMNKLVIFGENRPLFLQLTSAKNEIVINYYKMENSAIFELTISNKNSEYLKDIPDKTFEQLPFFGHFSMIVRYLWGTSIERYYLELIALQVAGRGSKSDFLAALDAPFDEDGRILHPEAQKILFCLFEMEQQVNNPEVEHQDINLDQPASTFSENSTNPHDSHEYQSVLRTAVENGNKEIIDYLIAYWTPMIQQLPFEHKMKISSAAFETKQFDVLCDLLDISDFPFPSNFKVTDELVNHERFSKILADRQELNAGIVEEDFDKINKFINRNLGLKTIYNTENSSTLAVALDLKKFTILYYLKSFGLQGINCEDIPSKLSVDEKKEAEKIEIEQRRNNVKNSMPNFHKSVLMLCSRSFVHNRKISKNQEFEYHNYIMKWFEDIYKVAPEMLDVAASCGHLKIIFDFESNSVSLYN